MFSKKEYRLKKRRAWLEINTGTKEDPAWFTTDGLDIKFSVKSYIPYIFTEGKFTVTNIPDSVMRNSVFNVSKIPENEINFYCGYDNEAEQIFSGDITYTRVSMPPNRDIEISCVFNYLSSQDYVKIDVPTLEGDESYPLDVLLGHIAEQLGLELTIHGEIKDKYKYKNFSYQGAKKEFLAESSGNIYLLLKANENKNIRIIYSNTTLDIYVNYESPVWHTIGRYREHEPIGEIAYNEFLATVKIPLDIHIYPFDMVELIDTNFGREYIDEGQIISVEHTGSILGNDYFTVLTILMSHYLDNFATSKSKET